MSIKRNDAFTVIEILIVVAIIATICAIIIPNLFMARRTANESAAKSNLRGMSTAAETLNAAKNHYPNDLEEFETYLPSVKSFCSDLAGAKTQQKGYEYSCVSDVNGYTFEASPITAGVTGNIIYTITTGVILTPS